MKDKELKEKFIDEKTGIEYIKQGDYYVPNLILSRKFSDSLIVLSPTLDTEFLRITFSIFLSCSILPT